MKNPIRTFIVGLIEALTTMDDGLPVVVKHECYKHNCHCQQHDHTPRPPRPPLPRKPKQEET